MPYVVGVGLAICVSVFARVVGLDRDRAFYPTVLIVVALYYVLFAVTGGSRSALAIESTIMAGFAVAAVVGFKKNPWIVAVGLAGHGVLDFFHGGLVANPGVPEWWPPFCLAYDLTAAGCLAWLSRRPEFIKR